MKAKFILTGILTAAFLFSCKTDGVFAATPARDRSFICTFSETPCSYCGSGCSYVDEDGDGVCDNFVCPAGQGFVDEDKDGICDYNSCPAGQGFVDEDGDGVCDNYASGRGGCGRPRGRCGNGGGRGCRRR